MAMVKTGKGKKAEYGAKPSELRYRRLFETAQDGILLIDFDTGMILDVNKFLIDLLGYSKVDFLKKYLWDVGVFKDIVASKDNFSILREKKYVRFENLPIQTKTGKVINVEFVANAYQVDDTTVIQCNIRDITHRKQAEKNLKNANIAVQNVLEDLDIEKSKVEIARAKEEAILMSVGDGLLATDEKGNITLVNKIAEKLFGKKSEEIMGKSFFEVIDIKDEKGVSIPLEKRPIKMALAGGTTTTTIGPAYYYVRKDKTKFPVAIKVTPVVADNKIVGTIEVFRDITQEKSVDRLKSEFISTASHQLRTPLTAIKWVVERILKTQKLSMEATEYLGDIHTSTQRLSDLIDTLLNVSRIEDGSIGIAPQPLDVVQFIKGYFSECMPLCAKKNISLKLTRYPETLPIKTDLSAFRNIVQSLVSNAIEYTPEKGKIEIEIEDKGTTFLVAVKDTGIGIPKGEGDKLFQKFYRAENAKLVKTDGTGLGLYIAKEATELLGGRIWFESPTATAKNKAEKAETPGSTFFVELPIEAKLKSGEKRFS
ncbi:MAG: PAS domain S-box protein [Patescibacteria group bacterium]